MKFFKITILFLLIFSTSISAQKISEHSKISLITCDAGDELYSTFGHSAIRITDTTQGFDIVFNYGTYNFSTKYFYWKFSRGTLMYMLSQCSYKDFLYEYFREKRSVYEQVLNLTYEEKKKLFDLLMENYLPQNRYYHYDFFKDNCSTRIRDIFQKALDDKVQLHSTSTNNGKNETFRQLIYPYMDNMQWSRFGIDILLGMPTDKIATNADYMFLPHELMKELSEQKIYGQFFARKVITVYEAPQRKRSNTISPDFAFWILFVLVAALSWLEVKKRKYFKFFDRIFFLCLALISVLILFLWIFSLHYPVRNNLNILWINPIYFYIIFKLEKSKIAVIYFCIVCNAIILGGWYFLPQQFNTAFIPIIITAILRLSLMIYHKRKLKSMLLEA